ncbi:MAG: putative addiction module antidote protein [Thiothrix sp.]|nr:putative addiction module antidote protein [Thiothrix sp.]
MIQTHQFDPAEHLLTDEDVIGFLEDMAENRSPSEFLHGLNTASRSPGMEMLMDKIGKTRAALCRSLMQQENPSFAMVYRVVDALGLHLSAREAA